MTTRSREQAPHPEWVLRYRNALPGRRIAELADVPLYTVSYHLRLACAADPDLRPSHEEAANARNSQVTDHGMKQMQQLVNMV